jgi:type II secretory pathway pseudopilin PulG
MFNLGRKQKGLSLIEALIVLGILASVVAAIALNASKANVKKNIQSLNQEVFQIFDGVQRVFGDEGTNGLTNTNATQLGIKPATVRGANEVWRHPFEGKYTLTGPAAGAISYSFDLALSKIPTGEACTEAISAAKKANWTEITVGSINKVSAEWTNLVTAGVCDNTGSTQSVDITFKYVSEDD